MNAKEYLDRYTFPAIDPVKDGVIRVMESYYQHRISEITEEEITNIIEQNIIIYDDGMGTVYATTHSNAAKAILSKLKGE